jgi:hypothetical protein
MTPTEAKRIEFIQRCIESSKYHRWRCEYWHGGWSCICVDVSAMEEGLR